MSMVKTASSIMSK